jgi:hypothetical protein
MPLGNYNRDHADVGSAIDKVDFQKYEHPPLDLVLFYEAGSGQEADIEIGQLVTSKVRIYCPDIRVISRIAVVFESIDPSKKDSYSLAPLRNSIIAFRCLNSQNGRVSRVGEIIGKQGVPYEFPKSDIDGIAFQTDDDMPWIDVDLQLGFPGVAGRWVCYYHATSNNKLKREEWQAYISRVTMSSQNGFAKLAFANGTSR